MSTTLILAIAAALVLVIVILLLAKLIKQFLGLFLILLVIAGAFFGVKYLDSKTNLRTNVPAIDAAFTQMQKDGETFGLSGIQANYIAKSVGITVIYIVNSPYSDEAFAFLSEHTRDILLDEQNFEKILAMTENGALPSELHMLVKWEGFSGAEYVAKRTAQEPPADPKLLYGEFTRLVGTPATTAPAEG